MDYYSFNENIEDSKLLKIIKGSPLDEVITETTKEVKPLRVGMCTISRIEPLLMRKGSKVSPSDRLFIQYFNNKKEFFEYIRLLSMNIGKTRFDTDGTIQFDKGKHREFDCVPACDVDEMLKKDFPSIFYTFVLDMEPSGARHICGLFLYDQANAERVHLSDSLSRDKKYCLNNIQELDRSITSYLLDTDRLLVVGPNNLKLLETNNWLMGGDHISTKEDSE